jgi:hypothetical protein
MFNSVYNGVPYLNDRIYTLFEQYAFFTAYPGWVLNTWIHTCLVISPTEYSFYLNGNQITLFDISVSPYQGFQYPTVSYSTGNNWIGRTLLSSGPSLFKGYVDEIRIYNRTLRLRCAMAPASS